MLLYCPWLLSLHVDDGQVNMLLYCPWLLSLLVGDDQQSICSYTVHGYYPYM